MNSIALYCSSESWGGLEMNVLSAALELQERGWIPTIYCVRHSQLAIRAGQADVEVVYVRRQAALLDLAAAWTLSRHLRRRSCRLIVTMLNRDLSLLAWLKALDPGYFRTVYRQNMGIGLDKKDIVHKRRYARLDAWISPLASLAREVVARTTMAPSHVHIIPLSIDARKLRPSMAQSEARKVLGLEQGNHYLGVIGRLDPAKGQDFIIRILARLRAENNDLHLVLMGAASVGLGSDYEQALRQLCRDEKVESYVHFLPFLDEPAVFYRAVDVCVMATLSETFGMVTVEAMMSGCAVVGSRSGGTPELLDFGARGQLFEARSEVECIAAIRRSLSERDLGKLSDIAREVSSLYAQDAITPQLETVYTSLLRH